jgi:hypothetical protein
MAARRGQTGRFPIIPTSGHDMLPSCRWAPPYFLAAASTLRVGSAPCQLTSAVGPYLGTTLFPSNLRAPLEGVGAVPGAIIGGILKGVAGAAGGVFKGAVFAGVCSNFGAYK